MLMRGCLCISVIVLLFLYTTVVQAQGDFALDRAISIQGRLLMLDDATPHVAVVVQAVSPSPDNEGEPVVAETVLSNESGEYQFTKLKPGNYQVRCQIPEQYTYFGQKAGSTKGTVLKVEQGKTLKNINFRFPPIKKGNWRHYTSIDGLAHNTANKIYIDPDGFMWLGVDSGRVSRFDGKNFLNFSAVDGLPPYSSIYAIHGDTDGVMWLGTFNKGVYHYDSRGMGDFPHFTKFGEGVEGLANAFAIFAINSDSSGAIWFGTYNGLYRYDGENFDKFTTDDGLAGNTISIIHQAPDGMMWFMTENGVSRYDGEKFDSFSFKDAIVEHYNAFTNLANDHAMPIHLSLNEELWCAPRANVRELMQTGGFGVFGYDGESYTNFTTRDGLPHNRVVSIQSTSDGAAWFGMWGGGMSRYDGESLVNFTSQDGLLSNTVKQLYTDPDGVIWVASGSSMEYFARGGLSRYDPQGLINFTTRDGLPDNSIAALHRSPDGDIWIGTPRGVSRYNGKSFTNFTEKDGLASNYATTIKSDRDGIIWFGKADLFIDSEGVSRYDTRTGKFLKPLTTADGLASNRAFSIYTAPDGVIWFGTAAGLSRYDTRTGEFLEPLGKAEDGLTGSAVVSINCDPDGVMWFLSYPSIPSLTLTTVGSRIAFIIRYDGKKFDKFSAREGFLLQMAAFFRDRDKPFWAGSRYGIQRYDGNEPFNFTEKDGPAETHINAMYPNIDGGGFGLVPQGEIVWFGTDSKGVTFYDGFAWSTLDTRDGLAGNTVNEIVQDADGSLWFGTGDGGLTRYRRSTSRPKVYIASVTADETYRDLSALPDFAVGTRVTIEYNAIDFKTIAEKRQYRYRLQAHQAFGKSLSKKEMDADWRKATKETSFDHTFDEPGNYTFEVQAIDRDLNYSEPVSVGIKIQSPPFYTRAGFIIGAILVAFLVPASAFATVLIRQRRQTFEPIQNPYIVGNPIRTKEMFFGRQSDFDFVQAKLASGQSGQVIVFAGERRSGKTSILFQILDGALGEQFVPVLMDMQAMTVDSEAEFLEKMAFGIDEALVAAGYSPYPEPVDFHAGNPTRTFERFMAQIMETLGDKSLLLLLDEYELIELKIADGILRSDLITFFASLLEAHPRLSFIFTGSRHLQRKSTEYWNILIGKSLYRRISFLSVEDAVRLITEPVQDLVAYPRGIPERIIRLTAGQPFYTQVVCQNMMDRLNEAKRNRVRQEDVEAVAAELADNPLPQMIYFWDGLEQDQTGALSLLGEALEDSNTYASAQTLLNFAQEQNLTVESELSDMERVLNDLFVDEILERERAGAGGYEYRFRVDLFRLWVRQAHSVWEWARIVGENFNE